jgi:ankyrin repeat protein
MAYAAAAPAGGSAAPSPPFTFLDTPCDLLACLGPVASTPGYAEEMDGTQRLCTAARDDAMLGAATADLRYFEERRDHCTSRALRGHACARSRLRYACKKNDKARVQWLVECGARDVAAAAEEGYTGGAALVCRMAADPLVDATAALVTAAHLGVAELVAPLVSRGAGLNYSALVKCVILSALQAAGALGHVEMVAALLAAGAAVDVRERMWTWRAKYDSGEEEGEEEEEEEEEEGEWEGEHNCTPLMLAAWHGAPRCLETAQALVAAGANVNRRVAGLSAAGWATKPAEDEWDSVDASEEQKLAVAAYLCALPQADPSAHIAAASMLGDEERVRDFIARGADVEERDGFGATCLMLAAQRGHVEVVRALLDAGADVDATDSAALSVLTCAEGKPAIMAALLERFEADGDTWRQEDLTLALFLAMSSSDPGSVACVRLLLAAGVDPNATSPYGGSLLKCAAHNGNVAAFQVLLEAGANVRGVEEEIRRCTLREAVPALLAALARARGGTGAAGGGPPPPPPTAARHPPGFIVPGTATVLGSCLAGRDTAAASAVFECAGDAGRVVKCIPLTHGGSLARVWAAAELQARAAAARLAPAVTSLSHSPAYAYLVMARVAGASLADMYGEEGTDAAVCEAAHPRVAAAVHAALEALAALRIVFHDRTAYNFMETGAFGAGNLLVVDFEHAELAATPEAARAALDAARAVEGARLWDPRFA